MDGLRRRLRGGAAAEGAGLKVDGVELETEEIAGAEPALVFLHEGLGSVALWRDFPARLAAATGRRALVYSRAGHGLLRRPGRPRGRRASCTRRRSTCCPRCCEPPASSAPVLVGHSDGGSIALIHASSHPVSGLVLLAPHVFVEDVTVASIEEARETFETTDLGERMGRYHRDAERTFRLWNDIWLAPEFRDWNIEDVLPGVTRPDAADPGRARPVRHARADRRDRARRCSGPVQRAVLDCRHAPHLEAPDETLAAARGVPGVSDLERHFVVPFEASFDARYGLEYLSPDARPR